MLRRPSVGRYVKCSKYCGKNDGEAAIEAAPAPANGSGSGGIGGMLIPAAAGGGVVLLVVIGVAVRCSRKKKRMILPASSVSDVVHRGVVLEPIELVELQPNGSLAGADSRFTRPVVGVQPPHDRLLQMSEAASPGVPKVGDAVRWLVPNPNPGFRFGTAGSDQWTPRVECREPTLGLFPMRAGAARSTPL